MLMNNTLGRLLLVVILVFSPTACSFVVDNEWKTLNKEVVLLYQEGEYEKAAEVAKRALKAAEETQGKNHPAVATMLNNLALLYQTRATLNQRCPYISAP